MGGRRRSSLAVWRRSLTFRSIAGAAIILVLAPLCRLSAASSETQGTRAASPAQTRSPLAPASQVVERLAPAAAEWEHQDKYTPVGILFDNDPATSLRTEGPASIRVLLTQVTLPAAVGVYGAADGWLSVSAITVDGNEAPIAGLQDLDLRSLPLTWNRFWSTSSGKPSQRDIATNQLMFRWRPASPDAVLSDLELWGLGTDTPERQTPLVDRVLMGAQLGTVTSWAEPAGLAVSTPAVGLEEAAVFRVRVDSEPRLMGRTFLVYDLTGLPHFTAVPRQINGFSVLGGFHPELGAAGATQIEEISSDWLFRGDNEIRFYPADEKDPV